MLCWSHVDDKTALTRRGVDSTQTALWYLHQDAEHLSQMLRLAASHRFE